MLSGFKAANLCSSNWVQRTQGVVQSPTVDCLLGVWLCDCIVWLVLLSTTTTTDHTVKTHISHVTIKASGHVHIAWMCVVRGWAGRTGCCLYVVEFCDLITWLCGRGGVVNTQKNRLGHVTYFMEPHPPPYGCSWCRVDLLYLHLNSIFLYCTVFHRSSLILRSLWWKMWWRKLFGERSSGSAWRYLSSSSFEEDKACLFKVLCLETNAKRINTSPH
jgi:hypothetical protein